MSIPYAYHIANYDEVKVFPTLEACVQYLKWSSNHHGYGVASDVMRNPLSWVTAWFADGDQVPEDLTPFIKVNEVDEIEVAAYIDKLREEDRERERTAMEAARQAGRKPICVTGSAPLYMLDRDDLIRREIAARRYSWL